MTRFVLLLALLGCGRVGFEAGADARTDVTGAASCPGMTTVFDEDGDLAGDPCDACPHVAEAVQLDSDSDGVGDACDPEPFTPSQRLKFFDGFNSDLPEWNQGGMIGGGQFVFDVANTDSLAVLDVTGISFTLELRGSIGTMGTVPQQVFIGGDASMNERYYVELINDGAGRRRSLMYVQNVAYTELDGITQPAPIESGPFGLVLSFGFDRIDARVETMGAAPAVLTAPGTGMVTAARFVLYVKSLDVRFDYAVLIETL